jgi:glycerol-3-phosphate acyltransferase PlsX
MGGDLAPAATVAGAISLAQDDLHVLLVGDEGPLKDEITARGGLPPNVHVHHAAEVVEMDDAPGAALRRKRDSSVRVCFELARAGQADAVVTMGHSGAALATGMFVGKRLDAVLRPAITTMFPGRSGPVVLLDVGANLDCRTEHLHQWGLMGASLARIALGKLRPRVCVLANGEEDGKGTDLTRGAAALLSEAPGIHFLGHAEPKEMVDGKADVIVTDGWTGNLVLKTAEAVFSGVNRLLRETVESTYLSRAGGALLRPALRQAFARYDHREVGGALLLGIDTCVVVGHGSAEGRAVASAVRFAARLSRERLLDRIRGDLKAVGLDSGRGQRPAGGA